MWFQLVDRFKIEHSGWSLWKSRWIFGVP